MSLPKLEKEMHSEGLLNKELSIHSCNQRIAGHEFVLISIGSIEGLDPIVLRDPLVLMINDNFRQKRAYLKLAK